MAESRAVVGGKKQLKKSKEKKGGMRKLTAFFWAALVLVLAIAITYNRAQIHKSCHCSQVMFVFFSSAVYSIL